MWYYYGNNYEEAYYINSPIKIEDTKVLEQYEENYNFIIPIEDISNEHKLEILNKVLNWVTEHDEEFIKAFISATRITTMEAEILELI